MDRPAAPPAYPRHFAWLNYRDGKSMYLADAPRFVNYVRKTRALWGAAAAAEVVRRAEDRRDGSGGVFVCSVMKL